VEGVTRGGAAARRSLCSVDMTQENVRNRTTDTGRHTAASTIWSSLDGVLLRPASDRIAVAHHREEQREEAHVRETRERREQKSATSHHRRLAGYIAIR
jgi:hypothetical protein